MNLASVIGLDAISIGEISKKVRMSRSGLFAHFLSKEQLQLDLLKTAEKHFTDIVLKPASRPQKSIDRLRAIQSHWPNWYDKAPFDMTGGCIFINAMVEFDNHDGPVRDFLYDQQVRLLRHIKKLCDKAVLEGDLEPNTDSEQFAFEFYSQYLGYSIYKKFHGDKKAQDKFNNSIDRLIRQSQSPSRTPES